MNERQKKEIAGYQKTITAIYSLRDKADRLRVAKFLNEQRLYLQFIRLYYRAVDAENRKRIYLKFIYKMERYDLLDVFPKMNFEWE